MAVQVARAILLLVAFVVNSMPASSRVVRFAMSSPLPNGAHCFFLKNRSSALPSCKLSHQCVVNTVLPRSSSSPYSLKGQCVDKPIPPSDFKNFCIFQSTFYAVGTVGIRDSNLCDACNCIGVNGQAQCVCPPGPTCLVDLSNSQHPKFSCSSSEQSLCLVTPPIQAVGKYLKGKCVSPSATSTACVSAGPSWGPIFYADGAKGAISDGDFCTRCDCKGGKFVNCKKVAGCTV